MNIYEFMSDSPILSFFLAFLLAVMIECLCFRLPNRYFRSRNIAKHGWPPEHCDAYSDFKQKDDD